MANTNLPVKRSPGDTSLERALFAGDRKGLVERALAIAKGDTDQALDVIASMAIAVRKENTAILGRGEAFVRHTPAGDLLAVKAKIHLSEESKDLFHLWEMGKTVSSLTMQGIQKINSVAGCAIGQPPSVVVDGKPRTNPYIARTEDGGIERIVIAVDVVGPTPATGNPVIVQYTLDYDPRKDFLHMLHTIASCGHRGKKDGKRPMESSEVFEHCKLVSKDEVAGGIQAGRKFVELYGGVGYLVDLRHAEIRNAYGDFIQLLQNAPKKAITVARRNALLQHPAIGQFKSVVVTPAGEGEDAYGVADVDVIGWAGDARALHKMQQISEKIARGIPLKDEGFEVIEAAEEYDPTVHDAPLADQDPEDLQGRPVPEDAELDDDQAERNALIAWIDTALQHVNADQANALDYDPRNNTTEELWTIKKDLQEQGLDDLVEGGAE